MLNGNLEKIVLLASLLLLASMALHGVIHHDHPEEIFGRGEQTAFHGEDRKWWMVMMLAILLMAFSGILRNKLAGTWQIFFGNSFRQSFDFSKLFDPMREALRMGILHPKLCE